MTIKRTETATLLKRIQGFPVVALTGPRQSGKTTLVKTLFQEKPYVSLEDLDTRAFAQGDPRGFLAQYPDGAVLDEVQRVPDLFSYLQTRVDADGRMGLFILTGSQQFGLLSHITQSLAGRVSLLTLLPFSLEELQAAHQAPASLDTLLFKGMYPPVYDRNLEPEVWYEDYLATYIERDVRSLLNVKDMLTFQRFVQLCAGYTGQLINLAAMANDCGISQPTAQAWLSVLEASYLLYLLKPHHENFNKRLVKMPKLYFYDTGLACRLMGIQTEKQLAVHRSRGALFETWVAGELLKQRLHRGRPRNLFFWRDKTGNEIDILIDEGDKLDPVEIKSGQTVTPDFFKGLSRWLDKADKQAGQPWLIYGGSQQQTRQGIRIIPWQEIHCLAKNL